MDLHLLEGGQKMKNLINCGTCGYPLTPEERTTLIERDGVMVKPALVQEPVAYWIPKAEQFCIADPSGRPFAKAWQPLYTTPPAAQRQWVGLTDEEIEKGRDQTFSINNPYCPCDSKTMRKAARWAEFKLKEKNT
jgi:hypothetical protein